MMVRDLDHNLTQVAQRIEVARRRRTFAHACGVAAGVGCAVYLLARWWPMLTWPAQLVFSMTVAGLLIRACAASWRRAVDLRGAARRLEADFPELQTRLLAALEQEPDSQTGRFNLLQSRLFNEVGEHAKTHDWERVISPQALARSWRRQSASVLALVAVTLALGMLPKPSAALAPSDRASVAQDLKTSWTDFSVDPGDAEVERHAPLLVLLRCRNEVPRDVTLRWTPSEGHVESIVMTKSLDDPIFAGRLARIATDGVYQLEMDGVVSPEFRVTVYDLPALLHSSLTVSPPSYTEREPLELESALSATVIEGSQVALTCDLNKLDVQAELRDAEDGTVVPLISDVEQPRRYRANWLPDRSRKWQLHLTDGDGRKNRDPEEFVIDVVPNRRPELKLVFPGQDQRISPLQELTLEARVSDDFGILAAGVLVDLAGREQETFPITSALPAGEMHPLEYALGLEGSGVEPGEVVAYSFFADDYGPDGNVRRTLSELFFLEVRPFEESFRQMEAAGGQSGMEGASGAQNQTLDKLIDLQKQIVTATWNLQRRDPDLQRQQELDAVETLNDSQKEAREQFSKVSESLGGAAPQERIEAVAEAMETTIVEFTTVQESKTADRLAAAGKAAQAAFQGLTRLRPKDHRIMQGGQAGGGAGGGGSMSQQQLQQLELNDQANRYETEKQAREPGDSSAQKESLAILNRLKELAQRQLGVNQKLKEIKAELRTAQSEAEREEMERQLKQLRDEQQELLQDADAVRNRMQQTADPAQTADARRQLEETRKQLVDASESLQEGKLAQALSSGTRAERELEKLQDDFRKKTSAQLAESLQGLRTQSREMSETEEKIAEDLAKLGDPQDKSLRQRQEREKLAETLHEQRERLEELLKSLRKTVQEAESSEPLAAKKLYEAVRDAQQQKTEQALQATEQMVERGFLPEAAQAEELARKGIGQLRERIEEAAESILGDEVADLKRAKRELAELAAALQSEMSQAQEAGNSAEPGGEQQGSQPGEGNPAADQPANAETSAEGGGTSDTGSGGGSSNPTPEKTPSAPDDKGGLRRNRSSKSSSSQPGQGSGQPSDASGGQRGGPGGQGGPITGGGYGEWTDRLRDVESLVNDPELQAEVAKVREEARSMRAEFKRHSKLPNWDVVEEDVRQPLVELQRRLAEEIARRESPESLVPTDRDPVPQQYREMVRKYYERLGGGGEP
ncbi:MAG: hypothetical protein U0872_07195 [Planctomycetaceae bacterium]